MTDLFARAAEAVAQELSVAGRVALIIGGGAGLGRAAGLLFARGGAKVCLADVRPERVEEAVGAATAEGGEAVGLQIDVREPEQIQRAIDRTTEAFGRLDYMVNCAGITRIDPFLEVTLEQYRQSIDVNVTGSFFGTQLATKQMIAQGRGPDGVAGRVVNVTSPSAEGNSGY